MSHSRAFPIRGDGDGAQIEKLLKNRAAKTGRVIVVFIISVQKEIWMFSSKSDLNMHV